MRELRICLVHLPVLLECLELILPLRNDRRVLLCVLAHDLEQALEHLDGREVRTGILTSSNDVSIECRDPCLEYVRDNLRQE